MATTLIFNGAQTQVISNLDTYNYTVNTAGMHVASIQLTEVPMSGISIVIKNNSSTVATSTTPTDVQSTINLSVTINAAVNDIIGFVLTSSTPIDNQLNTIKAIINVHKGSSN